MHDENREVRVVSGQEYRSRKRAALLLRKRGLRKCGPLLLWSLVALLVSAGCVGGQSGTEGCEDPSLNTFDTRIAAEDAGPVDDTLMDDGGTDDAAPDAGADERDSGIELTALGTLEDERKQCVPKEQP